MQILQWLFKASQDRTRRSVATHDRSRSGLRAEEVKPGEPVLHNRGAAQPVSELELGYDEEKVKTKGTFTILLKRDDSRACFYSTLHSYHLKSLYKNQDLRYPGIDQLGMGHKVESGNVGGKVLPICDVASLGSIGADSTEDLEKDVQKRERRRAVSRVKELLRWAAAAKCNKGGSKAWKVLHFRHPAALKAPNDDSSSNSGKIRFKWDAGSCSTSSSVYSPPSLASSASKHNQMWMKNTSNMAVDLQSSECETITPRISKRGECVRTGQWITTDSDFVVLEL